MDAKTREALEASIKHWEDVVRDPLGTAVGASECALCQLFHSEYSHREPTCAGCPVFVQTGFKYCANSPYDDFDDHVNGDAPDETIARELAQKELAFLRSLRPQEDTP